MSRSKWKGPFQNQIIFTNLKPIKIFSRDSIISSFFINKSVYIHMGNGFKKVYLTKKHLGYKFGEFAITRIKKKIIKKLKKK